MEAINWVRWDTLITIDEFENRQYEGTWSLAQMLTSEKFKELNLCDAEAVLKGRLVHCGDKEWNWRRQNIIDERRRLLTEKGMTVKPVSGTELRAVLSIELAVAQQEGYIPALSVGDEAQAYTRTRRAATEKRWIMFRQDLKWLPEHIRERARQLLEKCPRGILAELDVCLYGDLESGFAYEHRRKQDFRAETCVQRGQSSVFRYHDANLTLASGNRASCSLVEFVDDHIAFGHLEAGLNLTERLRRRIEYPPDAFQEVGRTDIMQQIAHVIGLDIVLDCGSRLYMQVIFSRKDFGILWVGLFRAELQTRTQSDKLRSQTTPGHQASRVRAPNADKS